MSGHEAQKLYDIVSAAEEEGVDAPGLAIAAAIAFAKFWRGQPTDEQKAVCVESFKQNLEMACAIEKGNFAEAEISLGDMQRSVENTRSRRTPN
jgi:hypothetical protein